MTASPADAALQKLVNLLGRERAEAVVRETLASTGLTGLLTPDDRYRFARQLIKQGGVLEAVGKAMRIQAILHGAVEE